MSNYQSFDQILDDDLITAPAIAEERAIAKLAARLRAARSKLQRAKKPTDYLPETPTEPSKREAIRRSWTAAWQENQACPYCEAEFDGAPIVQKRVYSVRVSETGYKPESETEQQSMIQMAIDAHVTDTVCPQCAQDAREHEIEDHLLAGVMPKHLLRWEYRPPIWARWEADPHGFYSEIDPVDPEAFQHWYHPTGAEVSLADYIFGSHQFEATGAYRLPIPGHSVTGRIADPAPSK